jgi:RNA polymerase sigma-70 factor (ECF subfamily)
VPQSRNRAVPGRIPDECLPIHMSEAEVDELFAACIPRLKKATRRMLRSQQDCEDALQDGLLLAFRKLHQFEGRSSFSTWLYSIVRNTSRIHYRKTAGRQAISLESDISDTVPSSPKAEFVETRPSPEETCIQNERSETLRKTAREMPARYRSAIQYFHIEGLGEEETARRLRLTVGALKSRLHRSRGMLIGRMRRAHPARSSKSWGFGGAARAGLRARCGEGAQLDRP